MDCGGRVRRATPTLATLAHTWSDKQLLRSLRCVQGDPTASTTTSGWCCLTLHRILPAPVRGDTPLGQHSPFHCPLGEVRTLPSNTETRRGAIPSPTGHPPSWHQAPLGLSESSHQWPRSAAAALMSAHPYVLMPSRLSLSLESSRFNTNLSKLLTLKNTSLNIILKKTPPVASSKTKIITRN